MVLPFERRWFRLRCVLRRDKLLPEPYEQRGRARIRLDFPRAGLRWSGNPAGGLFRLGLISMMPHGSGQTMMIVPPMPRRAPLPAKLYYRTNVT